MVATDLLSESAIDFVSDGAENAGHRGVVILASLVLAEVQDRGDTGVVVTVVTGG